MEGCRIRCTAASYRDAVKDQTIVDTIPCVPDPSDPTYQRPLPNPEAAASERTVKIPRGTRVLVDMTAAAHDPAVFPERVVDVVPVRDAAAEGGHDGSPLVSRSE